MDSSSVLRDLLFKLPGGSGSEMTREMEGIEHIRAGPSQGGKRPEDMTPQELHGILWQVLSFRDSGVFAFSCSYYWSDIVRSREEDLAHYWFVFSHGLHVRLEPKTDKIPGLGPLIEKIMDSISGECGISNIFYRLTPYTVFVFTTLEVMFIHLSQESCL
jgi:hypothetical protein